MWEGLTKLHPASRALEPAGSAKEPAGKRRGGGKGETRKMKKKEKVPPCDGSIGHRPLRDCCPSGHLRYRQRKADRTAPMVSKQGAEQKEKYNEKEEDEEEEER